MIVKEWLLDKPGMSPLLSCFVPGERRGRGGRKGVEGSHIEGRATHGARDA